MQKLPIAITALSISIPLIFFGNRLTTLNVSEVNPPKFQSPSQSGSRLFDPRKLATLLDARDRALDAKPSNQTPSQQTTADEIGLESEREAEQRIRKQTESAIAARVHEIARPLNIPDNLCDVMMGVPSFEYSREWFMSHGVTFCEYGAALTAAYGSAPRFDMRQFPGEIVKAAGFIVRKPDGTDDFGCYFKWDGEAISLVGVWQADRGFRKRKSEPDIDGKCYGATYRLGLKRIGLESRYLPRSHPSIDDALKEYNASSRNAPQPNDTQLMTAAFSELRSRLNKFWNVPPGATAKLVVRITIKPDGYLSQNPQLISNNSVGDVTATRDGAITALVKAQPFDMFFGFKYDTWKTIDVTFDSTAR